MQISQIIPNLTSHQRVKKVADFHEYVILAKEEMLRGVHLFKLVPMDSSSVTPFLAGQYVSLTNPRYREPLEEHSFSIASAPHVTGHLEICMKVYGNWTQAAAKLSLGDRVLVKGPYGEFTWKEQIQNAVFLVGGIGISPLLSLLRDLEYKKSTAAITLIYGNQTPDTIMYHKELQRLAQSIHLRTVHVFSHLEEIHPWTGYRGFISSEILEKEVYFQKKPHFFFCGPPIFTHKVKAMLHTFGVWESFFHEEKLV